MEAGKSLVARESTELFPSAQQWQTMSQIADVLIKSNLLPQHVKTAQAALAIMLKGRELGVPSMHALSNIVVVQGKPTCSAELMLALDYRDHGDDAVIITETTAERCTISYKRRGWKERQTYSFTMDDAERAGITETQTWKRYPQAMLRARAISAVSRMAFPDSIAGMYVYEELGLSVEVDGGEQVVLSNERVEERVSQNTEVDPQSSAQPHAAGSVAGGASGSEALPRPKAGEQAQRSDAHRAQRPPSPSAQQDRGEQCDQVQAQRARPAVVATAQRRTSAPVSASLPAEPKGDAGQWTQKELADQIRTLATSEVKTLAQWQALTRQHAGIAAPRSASEMTPEWLLALYQALRAQDLREALQGAPDEDAVASVMNEALDRRERHEITMEQWGALCAAEETKTATQEGR